MRYEPEFGGLVRTQGQTVVVSLAWVAKSFEKPHQPRGFKEWKLLLMSEKMRRSEDGERLLIWVFMLVAFPLVSLVQVHTFQHYTPISSTIDFDVEASVAYQRHISQVGFELYLHSHLCK